MDYVEIFCDEQQLMYNRYNENLLLEELYFMVINQQDNWYPDIEPDKPIEVVPDCDSDCADYFNVSYEERESIKDWLYELRRWGI